MFDDDLFEFSFMFFAVLDRFQFGLLVISSAAQKLEFSSGLPEWTLIDLFLLGMSYFPRKIREFHHEEGVFHLELEVFPILAWGIPFNIRGEEVSRRIRFPRI